MDTPLFRTKTEWASWDIVGYGDAPLREKVFDVAKAESEPMVQSNGMADDFGWKAVTSIQGFHRSVVADRC